MDILIIHAMILLNAFPAFAILCYLLKKVPKGSFLVFMFTGCLLLMGHIIIFSVVTIFFALFKFYPNVGFFDWWILFIILQTPITFLWLGIFAVRRHKHA